MAGFLTKLQQQFVLLHDKYGAVETVRSCHIFTPAPAHPPNPLPRPPAPARPLRRAQYMYATSKLGLAAGAATPFNHQSHRQQHDPPDDWQRLTASASVRPILRVVGWLGWLTQPTMHRPKSDE